VSEKGYFVVHRKFLSGSLWLSEPFTRGQAWIDLIGLANHDEETAWVHGVAVKVKRGQLARAQDTLAERWRWSRGKVRRFLNNLEETEQQIKQQKGGAITIITITNYAKYQLGGRQSERDSDNERTSNGHQADVNKNRREVREPKKKDGDLFSGAEEYSDPRFVEWYELYPNKTSKIAAWRAWIKKKGGMTEQDRDLAYGRLVAWIKRREKKKAADGWVPAVPNPATWLNERRWEQEFHIEDDISTPRTGRPVVETRD
jgi:hypothetical protein